MGNFLCFNPSIVEFQTQCWFTYIKRFKRAEETLLSKGPCFCPTRQGTFPFNSSLLASKLDNRKIAKQFCSPLSVMVQAGTSFEFGVLFRGSDHDNAARIAHRSISCLRMMQI